MVNVLLKVAITKFSLISGKTPTLLIDAGNQILGPPKPKPRSIYKTEIL